LNNISMPKKPKTMKEQVNALWEITGNHVLTSLRVQNMKCNFLLGLVSVSVTLSGIAVAVVLMS